MELIIGIIYLIYAIWEEYKKWGKETDIMTNTTTTLKPLLIPGSPNWYKTYSTRLKKNRAVRKARAELRKSVYTLVCLVLFIIIYGNIAARLI